jgi:hypothetical protein
MFSKSRSRMVNLLFLNTYWENNNITLWFSEMDKQTYSKTPQIANFWAHSLIANPQISRFASQQIRKFLHNTAHLSKQSWKSSFDTIFSHVQNYCLICYIYKEKKYAFTSANHKQDWVCKSQIRKVSHLRRSANLIS